MLRLAPDVKLIVQAVAADENHTVELYRRGVRGIISRSISPDLLVRCVRRIAAGETWIDNQSVNWVIEAYRAQAAALVSPRNQPRLSPKEMSIITCITQGKRNKEIAFQLGTTEQVIKNYLRKIYDKLGVSDRLELALYCLHNKIIQTDVDEEAVAQKIVGGLSRPTRRRPPRNPIHQFISLFRRLRAGAGLARELEQPDQLCQFCAAQMPEQFLGRAANHRIHGAQQLQPRFGNLRPAPRGGRAGRGAAGSA